MPLKIVSMLPCIIPHGDPFKRFYGLFLWQEHCENICRTFAEHCCLFATVNIFLTLSQIFQRLVTILQHSVIYKYVHGLAVHKL